MTDNGGLTATTTRTVTVGVANVRPRPSPERTSPRAGPLQVTFSSSVGSGRPPTARSPTSSGTSATPRRCRTATTRSTIYPPGIHTATLTVTDDDGGTGSGLGDRRGERQPGARRCRLGRCHHRQARSRDLHRHGLRRPDGTIAAYSWDFGDSTNGSGASAGTPTRRPAAMMTKVPAS